jgi:glycerol uptake facilitator-like aquaporin
MNGEARVGNSSVRFFHAMEATMDIVRRSVSEALGTALLLATVTGSGIMGERLAGGNVAIALLANTLATGAGLLVLILTFGPLSGAHFNPAVTLAESWRGQFAWRDIPAYLLAQVAGAFVGVACAHLMFALPLYSASQHTRTGGAQWFSEFIATFGLLAVIQSTARTRPAITPLAVAAYITAAYWFTASTSFANPAVTLARAATDTFAGIRPLDAPAFIAAQLLGAAAATGLMRWIWQETAPVTKEDACCAEVAALQTALATVVDVCTSPALASNVAERKLWS